MKALSLTAKATLIALFLLVAASFSVPALAQQQKYITVKNNTSGTFIWYMYITAAGEDSWGPEQLGNNSIDPGFSRTWNIPWKGCYIDVKAVSFLGYVAERKSVNACGGAVWTFND